MLVEKARLADVKLSTPLLKGKPHLGEAKLSKVVLKEEHDRARVCAFKKRTVIEGFLINPILAQIETLLRLRVFFSLFPLNSVRSRSFGDPWEHLVRLCQIGIDNGFSSFGFPSII